MTESISEDRASVYEISYLIAPSIPEEKVPAEADAVKKIISDAGSSVIAEEAPHRMRLAYEMRRKTVSGSYDKYNEAYFGWIKFEVVSNAIESIKKAVEIVPSVLRMLVITTVRENTYLGKRAMAVAAEIGGRKASAPVERERLTEKPSVAAKDAAPVSIEEMDKSIDAMVKEAN
jgi:ribosomal protein S6